VVGVRELPGNCAPTSKGFSSIAKPNRFSWIGSAASSCCLRATSRPRSGPPDLVRPGSRPPGGQEPGLPGKNVCCPHAGGLAALSAWRLSWAMSPRLAARAAASSSSRSWSFSSKSVVCCSRVVIRALSCSVLSAPPMPDSRQACSPSASLGRSSRRQTWAARRGRTSASARVPR